MPRNAKQNSDEKFVARQNFYDAMHAFEEVVLMCDRAERKGGLHVSNPHFHTIRKEARAQLLEAGGFFGEGE